MEAMRTERSRARVAGGIATWAAVVVIGVTVAVRGDAGPAPFVCVLLAVAWAAWLVLVRPSVGLGDGGLVIVGPLRTVQVPWASVSDIDTGQSARVRTPAGTFAMWALPGTGPRGGASFATETQQIGNGAMGVMGAFGQNRAVDAGHMAAALRAEAAGLPGGQRAVLRAWARAGGGGSVVARDGRAAADGGVVVHTRWVDLAVLLVLVVAAIVIAVLV